MSLFLDYLLFLVVMRQKEIVLRRFPKGKLSEVKFLLGFSLRLAFSSYSSLTAASDDMNLQKTHCFRS